MAWPPYERRHGWKGTCENVLSKDVTVINYQHRIGMTRGGKWLYPCAGDCGEPASAAVKFGRHTEARLGRGQPGRGENCPTLQAWRHCLRKGSLAR